MAKVVFDERENVTELLKQLMEQGILVQCNSFIITVHQMSSELMKLLQMLSECGLSTIVYIVSDNNVEQYVRQGNSRLKIISIPILADLEEVL